LGATGIHPIFQVPTVLIRTTGSITSAGTLAPCAAPSIQLPQQRAAAFRRHVFV
jgi:hypothetical protein